MVSNGATEPDSARSFTDEHVADFAARGLTAQQAWDLDVRPVFTAADLPDGCPDYWTDEVRPAVEDNGALLPEWAYLPGRLYTFRSPFADADGFVEYQLKPDRPQVSVVNGKRRAAKYIFRKGANCVLHAARHLDDTGPMLIVEGTHQALVAATYAPAGMSVYGLAGAQSWFKDGLPTNDLFVGAGREVFICLDADAGSNRAVYEAGAKLATNLEVGEAASVRFIRLGDVTGGTNGLDDYLGNIPAARREQALLGLVNRARGMKPIDKPQLPARRMPAAGAADVEPSDPDTLFDETGKLRVRTASRVLRETYACALTEQMYVSVYRGGVFRRDRLTFKAAVGELLGERSFPAHRTAIEEYTEGDLYTAGRFLPNMYTDPLVNTLDGMLDLRTGELLPHDPAYMSNVQLPVRWNPNAKCPRYEKWISERVGCQVDALEELVSTMFDPSVTPQQVIFLYGPGGTGKGTFLRLMQAVAGEGNYSSESLHGLANGQFGAAELYGKILNVNGDLSSVPIDDISLFKQLSGEDPIPGNKKYGDKFTFRSQALLAFALNKPPVVSEDSNAFVRRARPFLFPSSFAFAEDRNVEQQLLGELEGIFLRWVRAWQRRFLGRGGREAKVNPIVQLDFESRIDKVYRFFNACLEVVPAEGGTAVDGATQTEIHQAFQKYADEQGARSMQMSRVIERLERIEGVKEVRFGPSRKRGLNVRILPTDQWGSTMSTFPSLEQIEVNRSSLSESDGDSGGVPATDVVSSSLTIAPGSPAKDVVSSSLTTAPGVTDESETSGGGASAAVPADSEKDKVRCLTNDLVLSDSTGSALAKQPPMGAARADRADLELQKSHSREEIYSQRSTSENISPLPYEGFGAADLPDLPAAPMGGCFGVSNPSESDVSGPETPMGGCFGGTEVAKQHESDLSTLDGVEVTHRDGYKIVRLSRLHREVPAVPPVGPPPPYPGDNPALRWLLDDPRFEVGPCTACGTSRVLSDDVWYVCPSCFPASVRPLSPTDPPENGS